MKKYCFYGANSKSITPINGDFSFVKDQRDLYDLLCKCWSIETCAPRLRKDWSNSNFTLGQCSITAFLVQDIFGGEVYGVLLPDGAFHCYNVIGDIEFDLTSEQFKTELDYSKGILQSREKHFANKEKYQRYNLLKSRLLNLKNN